MNISKDSKIGDILKEYPQLETQLGKISPQIQKLLNPVGKAVLSKLSIADAAKTLNVDSDTVISQIKDLIKKNK